MTYTAEPTLRWTGFTLPQKTISVVVNDSQPWANRLTISDMSTSPTAPLPVLSSSPATSILAQIWAQQDELIRAALEYRAKHGDPIENMSKLIPDTEESRRLWKEIMDEPYG